MHDVLLRLRGTLDRGDASAHALVMEHRAALAQACGRAGTQLVDRVMEFDFEAASRMVADLLDSMQDARATEA